MPLAGAPHAAENAPFSTRSKPTPFAPVASPPPSSFLFLLMAAINVINGYGHKSFTLMGVPSLKEMSNKWNGTGVMFSSTDGL
jgi:hypothetical protein